MSEQVSASALRGRKIFWLSLATVGLVTGCGGPDFAHMKPTVWKPAARLNVIGSEAHWTASDVVHLGQTSQVAIASRTIDPTGVDSFANSTLNSDSVGLEVFVLDGPIPTSLIRYSENHIGTRIEFLTSSIPSASQMVNTRYLYTDPVGVGYTAGWLVGQLGSKTGMPIGWLSDVPSAMPSLVRKACVAAAYATNTSVQFVPVTQITPGMTGMPRVIVVTRKLSATEWGTLSTSGVQVVSLVPQDVNSASLIAAPVVPGATEVEPDLVSYAKRKWVAGAQVVQTGPYLLLSNVIDPTVLTAVGKMQGNLTSASSTANTSWSWVPSPLQSTWAWIVK